MKYEQLLKYMSMIIDLEKNAYIQEKTIKYLERSASTLAVREQILKPGKIQYTASEEGFGPGLIVGIISCIAGFFIYPRIIPFNTSDGSFGNVFSTAIILLVICGFTGFIVGAIVKSFVNKSYNKKYENEAEEEYQYSLAEYDKAIQKENARIEEEMIKKNYLNEQIDTLKDLQKRRLRHLKIYIVIIL